MIIIAKSKWPYVEANLHLIEKWVRDGLNEKQVAKKLGISKSTFESYKKQHSDFLDSLKRGREDFVCEVENALAKRALGYSYSEVKTYEKHDGDKVVTYTETVTKHQPPDVGACALILKNKDRDENGNTKWSNDPAKLEHEKQVLAHRKIMDELRNF